MIAIYDNGIASCTVRGTARVIDLYLKSIDIYASFSARTRRTRARAIAPARLEGGGRAGVGAAGRDHRAK